ncbi:unnamed protein product [Rotaria socialis]
MPVTTRAAALRSQNKDDATPTPDQTTTATTSNNSTSRKCLSQQKKKRGKAHLNTTCNIPEICSTTQTHSSVSITASALEISNRIETEDKHPKTEIDVSLENVSANELVILSSSSCRSTSTTVKNESPVRKKKNDYSIVSLESSNDDENDIYAGDANDFMNIPVIKGDITIGKSNRGGKMVFMNGCGYLYMSITKETIGWRCARRSENCKAVIYTFKTTGEFSHWNRMCHSHTFDSNETRKREILTKIKNRVLDEFISIKVIIEEEYRKAKLSSEEKRSMPLPSQIESGLHKLRRKALPPLPRDQKFIMPSIYQETYCKERFLIYDKRKSAYGGRLIMHASEEQLNVLFNSETIFADGTFKVSPKLFDQLYVLLGIQHGEAVPVCFILTSNRRHETYEAIFRCFKRIGSEKGIELKPKTIICDFEKAFLPETNVTGCWFHFCQSCYRNIQELGLMKIYETHTESRQVLRAFMALALLPAYVIHEAYEVLKQKVANSSQGNQLEKFVLYFQKEWIDHFKPSMWCVNKSTWRTNNFAEAQNKRFFSRVVQPHPNLWRFLQCLKQEESVMSHRMVQTGLGFSTIKSTKSTRAAARKSNQIEKLTNLLHSKRRSVIDTVMSLAYLVGEPVCRGKKEKKKKNNVSTSDSSSILSSNCD